MQNMPKHDREVICAIVTHALALGFEVACADTELDWTTDPAAIFADLGECDEERISFRKPGDPTRKHWVYLVYGNGEGETVCDYRADAETREILAVADALARVQDMEALALQHRKPFTEDVGEGLQLSIAWTGTGFMYGLARGPDAPSLDLRRLQAVSWLATRPADDYRSAATVDQVVAVMAEVDKVPHLIERAA